MRKTLWVGLLIFQIWGQSIFAGEVALKNFRELYESLQVVTGIQAFSFPKISKTYEAVYETLPALGQVKEFSPSMHWALLRLVSEFCAERIKQDSILTPPNRWFHKQIQFDKAPDKQNEALITTINEYSEVFWQRSLKIKEKEVLQNYLIETIKELNSSSESLPSLLISTCTLFGFSPDFFMRH